MYPKTHFKVLFNLARISKTCAHIIFLLNTRHDQELNKIGTITFGSTKLELHIFESIHKSCEKQLNKTKKENLTLLLGQPEGHGGPQLTLARPNTRRGPGWLPPQQRRLTKGTHTSVRETGEEERPVA